MLHKDPIPDRFITRKANQLLISRGIRLPCNIEVQTARGVVTLSGKIEYEHQRAAALHAVHQIDGVSCIVDRLHVIPKALPWAMGSETHQPQPTE